MQIQGRTKSLYSTMKKLLRMDDVAKGGRGRDEVYDLLGMRVIVTPYPDLPVEEGELAATQVWLTLLKCKDLSVTIFKSDMTSAAHGCLIKHSVPSKAHQEVISGCIVNQCGVG